METSLENFLMFLFEGTSTGGVHTIAVLIYALFAFVVLDVLTGWGKGLYEGKLDSAKNYKGYLRKLGLFTVAILFIILDLLISTGLGSVALNLPLAETPILSSVVLVWLMLGEVLSILENLGAMDINMPKFIETGLNRLHTDIDEGNVNIKSKISKDEEGNLIVENRMKVSQEEKENRKEDENGSSKEETNYDEGKH